MVFETGEEEVEGRGNDDLKSIARVRVGYHLVERKKRNERRNERRVARIGAYEGFGRLKPGV